MNLNGETGVSTNTTYFPPAGGIPFKYYPYLGKRRNPNYLTPLVAVQFQQVRVRFVLFSSVSMTYLFFSSKFHRFFGHSSSGAGSSLWYVWEYTAMACHTPWDPNGVKTWERKGHHCSRRGQGSLLLGTHQLMVFLVCSEEERLFFADCLEF